MSKTFIKHDQIQEITENQHHNKKHDLSSKDHSGKLDESNIKYNNPPLHEHPKDRKIKVKTQNTKATEPRSIIEFHGTGITVQDVVNQDKIIVGIPSAGSSDHSTLLNLDFASAGHTGFAETSHSHAGTDITSGTIDGDRLPAMSETKKGSVPATGVTSGKFLSDNGVWATPSGGGGSFRRWMPGATVSGLVQFAGLCSHAQVGNTLTLPVLRMYTLPFITDDPIVRKVIALGVDVRTASADLYIRMGIYSKNATDGNIFPGALLMDFGKQKCDSNKVWEFPPPSPLTLERGSLYHVVLLCESVGAGGARAVARFSDTQMFPFYGGLRTSYYGVVNTTLYGLYADITAGGLPDPWPIGSKNFMNENIAVVIGVVLDPI